MSIKQTFPNTISLPVTNEYDKGAVMHISSVFGHLYINVCWRILWNGTFQTFIWLGFPSPSLQKWNSAFENLTCCLLKGPLKRNFLGIYLTTFSEFVISKIQKLWGSPFCLKHSNFNTDFKIASRNWEKVFVYAIIASELLSLNCSYEEQDTFHRQPMS